MPVYQFEIPEEVEEFIRSEFKTEPQTYIQNELVDPIIKRYESSVRTVKLAAAEKEITTDVAKVKKKMKIIDPKKEGKNK